MRRYGLFATLFVFFITSSCISRIEPDTASPPTADPSDAAAALRSFFWYLSEGNYAEAAALYGGTYEVLHDNNPTLPPDDFQGLLKNACEINGYKCLPVNEVLAVDRLSSSEVLVTVNFLAENGEIFERGPCCGAFVEDQPPQSEFQFLVAVSESGEYRVMDLPVYVP